MLTKLFAALLTVLLALGTVPGQPTPEEPALNAPKEVNEASIPGPEVSVELPPAEKTTEPIAATAPAAESAKQEVTAEQAKQIALAHAGLTAEQVTRLKVERDREKGIWVYEVEFRQGRWEYDYEIHVETGKVLEWDKEFDD